MDWLALALAGFKLVLGLLDYAKSRQQFNAGHDAAVLDMAKQIMARSEQGKRIVEVIDGLGEDDLNRLESELAGGGADAK